MKKMLSILALAGLIAAPLTVFAADSAAGYYSTKHPQAAGANASGTHHHITNIKVVNNSSSTIYATVPGTPVYDMLYPNETDHIYNDNPSIYWTHLRILNRYQDNYNPIFDGDVCPRAVLNVSGGPGGYSVSLDSSDC